jgi:hypothetical protein
MAHFSRPHSTQYFHAPPPPEEVAFIMDHGKRLVRQHLMNMLADHDFRTANGAVLFDELLGPRRDRFWKFFCIRGCR